MNRNSKKGFTIVELIIVIAVIAVLAAVLIPTFSNLIQKANVAADQTLIKNLNTALAMDTDVSKHETMTQALEATKANGFDVEKIVARATKNRIVWDSVNDCFAYIEEGKTEPTYIPDTKTDAKVGKYQLWTIVNNTTLDATYSSYIAGTSVSGAVEATKGVDVGENTGITAVTYKNETATAQTVTIRTNSVGTILNINGKLDTVIHFGKANSVNVQSVAQSSYHEFGNVVSSIIVKDGRIVLENTSKVTSVVVDADVTSIKNKSAAISVDTTKSPSTSVIVDSDVKSAMTEVGGNNGFNVAEEQLITADNNSEVAIGNVNYATFAEALNSAKKGDVITLLKDVNFDGKITDEKNVSINMNGKSIYTQDSTNSAHGITIEHAKVIFAGNGYIKSHENNAIYSNALVYVNGSTSDADVDYTYVEFGAGIKFVTKNNNSSVSGKEVSKYGCFAYGIVPNKSKGESGSWNTRGITISYAAEILDGWGTSINGQITNPVNAPTFVFEEGAVVTGIYAAGYANWIINGGTFSSGTEFDAGNIVINGGNFIASGDKECIIENKNGASCTGYALAIVSRPGYAKSVSCTINDGSFNTEIIVVNKTSDATSILTINKIGSNNGVLKYNAVVVVPNYVTVGDYTEK